MWAGDSFGGEEAQLKWHAMWMETILAWQNHKWLPGSGVPSEWNDCVTCLAGKMKRVKNGYRYLPQLDATSNLSVAGKRWDMFQMATCLRQVRKIWREKGKKYTKATRVRQAIWLGSIMAGKVQNGYLSTPGYLVRMHYGGKSSKWLPEYARLLG